MVMVPPSSPYIFSISTHCNNYRSFNQIVYRCSSSPRDYNNFILPYIHFTPLLFIDRDFHFTSLSDPNPSINVYRTYVRNTFTTILPTTTAFIHISIHKDRPTSTLQNLYINTSIKQQYYDFPSIHPSTTNQSTPLTTQLLQLLYLYNNSSDNDSNSRK